MCLGIMVTPLRVLRKGLNPQKETQCMLQLLPEVRILAARLEAEIRLIFRGDLSHLSLKGNLRINNLVDFETFLISRSAAVPGL